MRCEEIMTESQKEPAQDTQQPLIRKQLAGFAPRTNKTLSLKLPQV